VIRDSVNYSFHKSREIDHVNGWDSVLSFSNERELLRSLEPSSLEVIVENSLSISIENTSAEDVGLEFWFCFGGAESEGLKSFELLESR
jgi:hypothetical protein